jgi:hypothetical protein
MNTHQPHFSSFAKRSVNGTQMVFTHAMRKSHVCLSISHVSCYMNSNEIRHMRLLQNFFVQYSPYIMRISRELDT